MVAPRTTLAQLQTTIPLGLRRELEATLKPLAPQGTLPRQQDLRQFWRRAESVLNTLADGVHVSAFNTAHITLFGPLVLGETTWELFSSQSFGNWSEFKEKVEARFGLSLK